MRTDCLISITLLCSEIISTGGILPSLIGTPVSPLWTDLCFAIRLSCWAAKGALRVQCNIALWITEGDTGKSHINQVPEQHFSLFYRCDFLSSCDLFSCIFIVDQLPRLEWYIKHFKRLKDFRLSMDLYLYGIVCLSLHYCAGLSMVITTDTFLWVFVVVLNSAKVFKTQIADGLKKIMNCGIILILIIKIWLAIWSLIPFTPE